MRVFDEVDRYDDGPAAYSESAFAYLSRSARADVGRVRDLVETWLTRYPEVHQPELAARLRHDFDAAFFELFLHELLTRTCRAVEVHPSVGTTDKRPDFGAYSVTGSLVVEATLARDESDADRGKRRMRAQIFDEINKLRLSNFLLDVHLIETPNVAPSGRSLRRFLADTFNSLDADEIVAKYAARGWMGLPCFQYRTPEGLHLEIRPIPVKRDRRGTARDRCIGLRSEGGGWIAPQEAIRTSVHRKATRYGVLARPYVVAINAVAEHPPDHDDVLQALFGDEQIVVAMLESGAPGPARAARAPNGAWRGTAGPRNTRVSGVLVGRPLTAWNIPRAAVALYHNPWAEFPLPPEALPIEQWAILDGELRQTPGRPLHELFGLPKNWPETAE